jgi:hypothetical protein
MLIINNGYIVDTILSFEFDMDKMKNQDLYDNTIYQVDLKGVKGGSNLKAHLSIEFSPGWFVKNTWINMSVFKLVEDGQWKYVGSYLGDIPTDYRSEVFRLESLQSE